MAVEYAVYKGEQLIVMGTRKHCAQVMRVKEATVYYYTSDAYERKRLKRKCPDSAKTAFVVDEI